MANVFLLATTGAVFFFSSFGAFFTACGCGSATFSTARAGGASGAGAAGAGAGAGAEAGALATAAPAFWSLPFLPFFVVISATTGSGSGAATFTCSSWTSSASVSESERRAANPFFCGMALFFGGMAHKSARADDSDEMRLALRGVSVLGLEPVVGIWLTALGVSTMKGLGQLPTNEDCAHIGRNPRLESIEASSQSLSSSDDSPMSVANVFLLATTGAVFFFSSLGAFFTGGGAAAFSTTTSLTGAGAATAATGAGTETGAAGAAGAEASAAAPLPFLPFFVVISSTTGSGSGAATFTCSSWTSSSSLSESERRAANPFFCGIALFFGGMPRKAARARRLRCDEAGVPGSQRAWA
eukprot:CAMPEP_0183485176 /NCGR_PEP_ID=MMETSP0370-20130417/179292_1 /TAXON_ID=268820 /ORGANISM="Peridinium aciculiferum, Strain PAER-2" /LENGTH=355 /DNA_ID=CAMNT_0025678473 /DNA_START=273 /DNA_END=1342 /DNA_ORIENTATION=-